MRKTTSELEQGYLDYSFGTDKYKMFAAVGIFVFVAIMFFVYDLYKIQQVAQARNMAILRIANVVVILLAFLAFRFKLLPGVLWERAVAIALFVLLPIYYYINEYHILYFSRYEHSPFIVTGLLYLVTYFMLIPIHNLWLKTVPGIAIMAVNMLLVAWDGRCAEEDDVVVCVVIMIITLLCVYFNVHRESNNRSAYSSAMRERKLRTDLEKALQNEEKYHAAERSKLAVEAELKMLNAQIKPHFLFDVVGTSAELARSNPEYAAFVFDKFAAYLQGVISVGREFSSVADELKLVDAYLNLQKVRMGERLTFEVTSEIKDKVAVVIPAYSIQTLVENAVIHGLKDCENGGKVVVKAVSKAYGVEITVEDNGCGIGDAEIGRIYAKNDDEMMRYNEGIGLWNVNRRLVLSNNPPLEIYRKSNGGTLVRLEILH